MKKRTIIQFSRGINDRLNVNRAYIKAIKNSLITILENNICNDAKKVTNKWWGYKVLA